MHYLELFDLIGLDRFHLVGLSLGGYLAAKFSCEHGHRVKKLALIAPAGIIDPKHPMMDVVAVPGEQIPGLLVSNFDVLKKRLPAQPDLDFIGERYREASTVARLLWEHPADPKFMRYLHRLKMPTLILWGDEDKIIPVQQTETWRKFLPQADIKVFKGAGHLVHLEKPEAVDAVTAFLS
jgi:pimeloyl-ACP methyl ester carboxylesterase